MFVGSKPVNELDGEVAVCFVFTVDCNFVEVFAADVVM